MKRSVSDDIRNEISNLSIQLNYLHRLAGLFAVLAANIHAIGYSAFLVSRCSIVYRVLIACSAVYKWSLAGTVSMHLSEPFIRWGFVGLVCFDMLGVFSVQFVRSKFYNVFFVTHVVGLIVLLFSVSVVL